MAATPAFRPAANYAFSMRLLDRYLLAEWLKIFGLTLVATLAVLLLYDLYGQLGDLRSYGAHGGQVLFYFAVLMPSYLPAVLPLSQLVSLLFAVGNLHRHNEIIAMRSAGISLWRISQPLWLGGLVLAVALWLLNASIVPWSVEHAREIRENLHYESEARTHANTDVGVIPQLTYENDAQHRLWFINHFSDYAYRGLGVTVYELDAQGRNKRYVLADEGYFDDAAGHWVLLRGRELLFDSSGQELRSLPFKEKSFPEFTEKPTLMKMLRQRPDDLSLAEIHEALVLAPPAENPAMHAFAVRYYEILASPFICLLIVGLAVPFAVAGVRVNPMVSASKSVGLFFAYYVVQQLCTHLANPDYLPPVFAAWLPIALMLGLGVWLFRRAV
jgi:lipopolysaccharide export system permease protein